MDDPSSLNPIPAPGERLHSWKEIAAYLKRDVRTVQRWEKQEGLPVHRHQHDERGTAYAYAGEIDTWLHTRSHAEAGDPVPAERPVEAGSASVHREPRRLPMVAVIVAVAVASLLAAWALSRPGPAPAPSLASLSVVFAATEVFHDWGPDVALSPDGSTLVYAGSSGLVVRRMDQLSGRALEGTGGSWGPFFSPDGTWIGFNHRGQLKKVPLNGGAPVPLGVSVGFIGAADWGTDGYIVYATITPDGTHGLYRVPAAGGPPQLVAALDDSADDAYFLTPQSVADGRIILCTLANTATSRFQVVAVSVATGERRVLLEDAKHALSIGDGVLVYWRNSALFATRVDADRFQVRGPHVPAWDEVGERVRLRSWTSAAGMLVYWPHARVNRRLVWVDRSGGQEPVALPPAMYQAPRLSPDGRSVAYGIGHDFSDVWIHDFMTGATVRMTSDGRSGTPVWTPDGDELIISSQRASGRRLVRLSVDGTAAPAPIRVPATFLPGAVLLPASWGADGRTLLVRQLGLEAQPGLWAVALDGSSEPRPARPEYPSTGHVSPDGRWLAYDASEGGGTQVYVTAFPDGGPQWKVSTDRGARPRWSRSGRELFFRDRRRMLAVPVTPGDSFQAGAPRALFDLSLYDGEPGSPNFDVAPGDQRFLTVLPATTDGPDRLNVIQGWKAELMRRLTESR